MAAPQSNATLTAVAQAAGVSVATASRALNGSTLLAAQTRERVRQIAEQMGYTPNPRFRAMGRAGGNTRPSTGNLGLLLPAAGAVEFATNPYYSRLFWAIQGAARENDLQVLVSDFDPTGDDSYLPRFVQDAAVDGTLVTASLDASLIRRIENVMPVVMVNALVEGLPIPCIMPNERAAIELSLNYLHGKLGHQRITFFDIHDDRSPHHEGRTRAFSEIATFPGARSVVLNGRTKSLEETVLDHLRQWRDEGQLPTALLCAADVYALAFLQAAETLGIAVPDEMSILGIDDTVACEQVRPRLTSIRQPLEAMGAAAVRLLIDRIKRRAGADAACRSTHLFDVELVVRDSCSPARGS